MQPGLAWDKCLVTERDTGAHPGLTQMQPETPQQLLDSVSHCIRMTGGAVEVMDESALDEELMRALALAATSPDAATAKSAAWLTWSLSQALGFGPGDPTGLVAAIDRRDVYSLRVPRFSLSRHPFDGALAALVACANLEIGIVIFAVEGCGPDQAEAAIAGILAAAVAGAWRYPVTLDGSLGGGDLAGLEMVNFGLETAAGEVASGRIMEELDRAGLSGTVAVLRRHLIPWPAPRPVPEELAGAIREPR